jgi:hypothetical protein
MKETIKLLTPEFGQMLVDHGKEYLESEDKVGYSLQSFFADLAQLISFEFEADAMEGIKTAKLIYDEAILLNAKLEEPHLLDKLSNEALQKITRTAEQQRERIYEGNAIQKLVKKHLEGQMTEINIFKNIKVYPSEGIDIRMKNGKTINIEVKSARQWEHDVKGKRRGRFWIKPDDFKADFFAFVVKQVDERLAWDESKPIQIQYVRTKDLIAYLKSKFKVEFESKRLNFKISIIEMLRLPSIERIPMEEHKIANHVNKSEPMKKKSKARATNK